MYVLSSSSVSLRQTSMWVSLTQVDRLLAKLGLTEVAGGESCREDCTASSRAVRSVFVVTAIVYEAVAVVVVEATSVVGGVTCETD